MNKKILILILIALLAIAALVAVLGQQKTIAPETETPAELQDPSDSETSTDTKTDQASGERSESIFILSASQGVAPLMVELTPQFKDMMDNWIDFGDGSTAEVSCLEYIPDTDQCAALTLISHTFKTPGTYTVSFMSGLKSSPAEAVVIASEMVEVE